MVNEKGTRGNPWQLKTPPGTSEYEMYRDVVGEREILVCTVGKTVLHYDARCIADLHALLKQHGDWMELGAADELKPAKDGTVEAWGRSPDNPIGGWYGLKKGLRGRFGMYLPPLIEELGLPRSNTIPETIACGPSSADRLADHCRELVGDGVALVERRLTRHPREGFVRGAGGSRQSI